LAAAVMAAAGVLAACERQTTQSYDPRVDGVAPPQLGSAEPGILDDQKTRVRPGGGGAAAPAAPAAAVPASAPAATQEAAPPPPPPPPPEEPAPAPPPAPPADSAPATPAPEAG
jgi:hypothetical protein